MRELNPALLPVVQALRDRFPGFVEVTGEEAACVFVTPNPDASPMYIISIDEEFVFGVGRGSCRWELQVTLDDLDFMRTVWDAVIAGQVSEVFGPARSRVQVRIGDGTIVQTESADFPRGCLPVPRWRRNRTRTVDYSEYRG